MTTTDAQQTVDYLAGIVATIKELERLCEDYAGITADQIREETAELTIDLKELADEYTNDEAAEMAAEIEQRTTDAALIQTEYDADETRNYCATYVSSALDIEIFGQLDSDWTSAVWTPCEIRVLLSFGGPEARVIYKGSGAWVTVEVEWWCKPITEGVHAPHLSAYLYELLEMHA